MYSLNYIVVSFLLIELNFDKKISPQIGNFVVMNLVPVVVLTVLNHFLVWSDVCALVSLSHTTTTGEHLEEWNGFSKLWNMKKEGRIEDLFILNLHFRIQVYSHILILK